MSTEYYDEVDENDVPTGRKITRQEAHEKRIAHRVAAVFVFHSDGRLYVQEHRKSNNRLDHTVGGHVRLGESYLEAAAREMAEEIGISKADLEEIVTSHYSDEGTRVHLFSVHSCVAPEGWVFEPNEEVAVLKLMKVEEIVADMNALGREHFTAGFLSTMKKYLEVIGSDLKVSFPR